MNSGTILAVLSLATAVGNLASYYPKMTSNRATLRLHPRCYRHRSRLIVSAWDLHQRTAAPAAGRGGRRPCSGFPWLDADGEEFRLSDLRGSPLLLKFYRGYWCPYCVAELAQLDQFAKDFEALGIKLVAVSSDRVDELRPFKRTHNWAIRLVADPGLAIHRLYNVQQRNFTPRRNPFRDLAIPTTILIDRDGRVRWLEQAVDFRVRPQAAMVLAKITALLSAIDLDGKAGDACDVCAA